jgi:hypothetical protein
MFSSIDEVIEVAKNEGIEADIVKDGLIHVATNNAQQRRLTHHVEELRTQGWDGNIADPFGLPTGERLRNAVSALAHDSQGAPREGAESQRWIGACSSPLSPPSGSY